MTLRVQQQATLEPIFAALAKGFEAKYPNVSVKLETVSIAAKTTTNLQTLSAGDPPDVGYVPLNSSVYATLLANAGLEPIDDVFQAAQLDKRYSKGLYDSLSVGGKHYATVYTSVFYSLLWYNPDAFAKAGITVPPDHRIKSVDDLIAMAGKLRAKGLAPIQLAGSSGYELGWLADTLLSTSASSDEYSNLLTNFNKTVTPTAAFTGPGFLNAVTTLKKLGDANVFQTGYMGQKDQEAALAPFLGGRAGMALGGNFTVADFAKNKLNFKPDWLLLPPVDSSRATEQTAYYGDALAVPSKAKQKDWAKKFLEFAMSDQMQQQAVMVAGKLLPAVNSVPTTAFSSLDPLTQSIAADAAARGQVPGFTSTAPGAFGQQFLDPNLQKMMLGQLTPQKVAATQQAELQKVRG